MKKPSNWTTTYQAEIDKAIADLHDLVPLFEIVEATEDGEYTHDLVNELMRDPDHRLVARLVFEEGKKQGYIQRANEEQRTPGC